jgi:hypothetical protein
MVPWDHGIGFAQEVITFAQTICFFAELLLSWEKPPRGNQEDANNVDGCGCYQGY